MTDSDDRTSAGRKRWELDREALEALLQALAPDDPSLAGRKYQALHRRLMDLFAWERCEAPDQLADETLNRLARKTAEGASIPHFDRYAFGIARLIIQEETRKRQSRGAALRELQPAIRHPSGENLNMLSALEECLAVLPHESRELIERYYAEDRSVLARKLDISVNALRNRAMRIREELFRCVSRKGDES